MLQTIVIWDNSWFTWGFTVVDPGFPIGGGPTSDAGAFQQKCMQKQKNWIPLGGGAAVPPGSANALNVKWSLITYIAKLILQESRTKSCLK